MLNFIKKVLLCFVNVEVINYVYSEEFDITEDIFYYYYCCENGFRF